jgi:hypothetical protein
VEVSLDRPRLKLMPDLRRALAPCTLITPLILKHPTCLDCIAAKGGVTADEAKATLSLIAAFLKLYRELERCRDCGETKEIYSVHRLTS